MNKNIIENALGFNNYFDFCKKHKLNPSHDSSLQSYKNQKGERYGTQIRISNKFISI